MSLKRTVSIGRQIRSWSVFLLITVLVHLAIARSGIFIKINGEIDKNGLSERVWQIINKDYIYKDKISDKAIYYGGIKGEVESLDDPYTVFLPPSENKTSQENLAGEFGGVGVSLGYKEGVLAVMSPLAKTPAERGGMRAGDLIIRIVDEANDVDVDTGDISIQRAVELIRGKIGTKVVLHVIREGEKEELTFELTRDNIVVPSVEVENLDYKGQKISWVKMYKFSDRLYEEWDETVGKILANNSDVVWLDLRNNPGGYLEGSVVIASDFVTDGVVVKQKTASGEIIEERVKKNMGRLKDKKLLVLINEGSASASEILAGSLRQNKGIKIIGQTSFGKGTVQRTEDFADGSGLHVTIAKWLLPDDQEIDGVGVEPDEEIKWEYDDDKDQEMVYNYMDKNSF